MSHDAIISLWRESIDSLSRLSVHGTTRPTNIPQVPRRIESFSQDLSLNLATSIVSRTPPDPWIEKIRRHIEVNRPRLEEISRSRFGTKEGAINALKRMGFVLAINAYQNNCLLSLNALGALVDTIPAVRKPHHDETVMLMESTLRLASRFVEMRHDR